MSLIKWLTAGKGLIFWHKSDPKYRVVEESFLPKFGGASGIVGGSPVGNSAPDKPTEPAPASIFQKPASVNGGRPVLLKAVLQDSSPSGKVITRLAAATEEKKRSEASRPGAKPYRRLVQSELSLDGVKVVRNDLSDADLEVVRVKPTAKPAEPAAPASMDGLFGGRPAEQAQTPAEADGRGVGVGRMISRWFGAVLVEQA